jgi:hypothetical protein
VRTISHEDHYLLVMVGTQGPPGHAFRRFLQLAAIAIAASGIIFTVAYLALKP